MKRDLRDLIGDEGSRDERLLRVHELLVEAGPPPDAVPALSHLDRRVAARSRRRRWAELALAATLAAIALAVGFVVGDRGGGFESSVTISMQGVPPMGHATAELAIGKPDEAGNVPIEMRVDGLPPLRRGGWYGLYLSKGREIGLLCGTFVTTQEKTTVRLSVGFDLGAWHRAGRYDGWVVTARVPGEPRSATRIIMTT